MYLRLENITAIDRAQIAAALAKGDSPIVQFSGPGYSSKLLSEINAACDEFGAGLEVRFYGHYGVAFDASCLTHLPHVASLSIDCLTSATNLNALFGLSRLRRLSLGVFDLGQPGILADLPLETLEALYLCETRRADVDLSPLIRARSLRRLHVSGHIRGFDTLAGLSAVADLTLRSIPKKQSLAIISHMRGLRNLLIILGGRTNIDEITHTELTRLDVVWVRGLSSLGTTARFPALRHLRVEDQLQLQSIDLATTSPALRRLSIFNCKNLRSLGELTEQRELIELRIGRTALDFEALLKSGLPDSLQCVAFYTGRKKVDDPMRRRLDALCYSEFPRPAAD